MRHKTYVIGSALLFLASMQIPVALASGGGGHHAPSGGVSAKKAFESLVDGNKHFVDGKLTAAPASPSGRAKLVSGQAPHTIVLSCSDSRVPPELVFDKGLGELFTVRVAGNVLGAATVASIEYAVEHLGSQLIVVMGHESCGAVKAALATPPEKTAGSPDLDTLVAGIRPNIESYRKPASDDKHFREPVKMNVNGVADQLIKRSAIVRKMVDEGKVSIVPAIYSLETGKVDFWNADKIR